MHDAIRHDPHAEHRDPQVAKILGDAAPIGGAELDKLRRRALRAGDPALLQWAFVNSELDLTLRLCDRLDRDFPVGDPSREAQQHSLRQMLVADVADWREARNAMQGVV